MIYSGYGYLKDFFLREIKPERERTVDREYVVRKWTVKMSRESGERKIKLILIFKGY